MVDLDLDLDLTLDLEALDMETFLHNLHPESL